jgi:tellurite resistance protein TerC
MKRIRSIAVAVVGGTVLALGIALIVLPGPAFIVIPAGLAILAIEFAWARRWLNQARRFFQRKNTSVQRKEVA